MRISDALLPEFDHETANTRKMLERIPDDKLGWRPHPKSFTLGELATHVATLPGWLTETINKDSIDVAPVGQPPYKNPVAKSRQELLERFDSSVAAGRTALAGADNETLMKPWSLLAGGKTIFTLPKAAVVRGFVMSHSIHHRGQLSVYLRLNDIPVPGMYGPTADEPGM